MRRGGEDDQGGYRHGQKEEQEQDAVLRKTFNSSWLNFLSQESESLNRVSPFVWSVYTRSGPVRININSTLNVNNHKRGNLIWREKRLFSIELEVVPMTSATCFHSSSCCSFLSFSSHLSSFLSMVEETFSSTRRTRGSTLSTENGEVFQLLFETNDTVVFRKEVTGMDPNVVVCHCMSIVVSAAMSWHRHNIDTFLKLVKGAKWD